MKRSGFALRKPDTKARLEVPLAQCRVCKQGFIQRTTLQSICSGQCAVKEAKQAERTIQLKIKADKAADRKKREALKTRGQWVDEAEREVRRFRRLTELAKGEGCISCLRPQAEVQGSEGWKPGGAWDAGHFLSKGARPELRMEPLNIWLQCKSCNAGSSKYARKGYTVGQDFEKNLRAKEGDALVDWLKGPHEPKHYSIDDLKAIKAKYRALANQLAKEIA